MILKTIPFPIQVQILCTTNTKLKRDTDCLQVIFEKICQNLSLSWLHHCQDRQRNGGSIPETRNTIQEYEFGKNHHPPLV